MNPSPIEQLCLRRASGPGGLANITSTTADQTPPTPTPDLRMAITHAPQDRSAAIDPVSTAAAFSPCIRAALISPRFSSPPPPKATWLSSDLFRRQRHLAALPDGSAKWRRQPMHRRGCAMTTATICSSNFRLCAVSLDGPFINQTDSERKREQALVIYDLLENNLISTP